MGVRADGRKELIALAGRYRESVESWATCCVTVLGAASAPRARGRRWLAGVLGRAARGLRRHPRAASLVPQDRPAAVRGLRTRRRGPELRQRQKPVVGGHQRPQLPTRTPNPRPTG